MIKNDLPKEPPDQSRGRDEAELPENYKQKNMKSYIVSWAPLFFLLVAALNERIPPEIVGVGFYARPKLSRWWFWWSWGWFV